MKLLLATESKRNAGITLLKLQKPKTSKSLCGTHSLKLQPPLFTTKIFVYGTLLLDEVVKNLGISVISRAPARLSGYRRVCIEKVDYPVAVEGSKEDFIDGEI